MTRWRLTAWLPDRPSVKVRKHWAGDCKLCAIAKAQDLAVTVANAHRRHVDNVRWTAEKLLMAKDGWEIVFHDGQRIGGLPKRHGH